MTVYIAVAVLPVLLEAAFPQTVTDKKQKRLLLWICGAVLLVLMGLRHYEVGSVDTANYRNAMMRAIDAPTFTAFYDPDSMEAGFQVFLFVLSRICHNPQWLLVITSAFYVFSVCWFIDRNSAYAGLSLTAYITLGLMQFHMQGMRQSIAMCICLFAYEQAKKRHMGRFVLLVLLAVTFHRTALVFLPVYFLARMKFHARNTALMAAVAAALMFLSAPAVALANRLLGRNYDMPASPGGYVATAIYAILIVLAALYYRKNGRGAPAPLFYILIIGASFYVMRYLGTVVAERVSYYFSFAQIIFLPYVYKMTVRHQQMLMYLLIVVLTVALFAYRLSGSNFLPYRFFWQ